MMRLVWSVYPSTGNGHVPGWSCILYVVTLSADSNSTLSARAAVLALVVVAVIGIVRHAQALPPLREEASNDPTDLPVRCIIRGLTLLFRPKPKNSPTSYPNGSEHGGTRQGGRFYRANDGAMHMPIDISCHGMPSGGRTQN